MNDNFYTIEITSAAYDQRFIHQMREAELAEAASAGRSTLLYKIMRLFTSGL